MPTAKKENVTISVSKLNQKSCTLRLIGTTPLYQNRMSAKAKQEFLVGGGKGKSKAERAHIKHDPLQEFVDAAEIIPDGPTALGMKVIAVKAAMATAALETEGVYKTEIQRLLFMPGDLVPLYGTPHLKMDIVRQGGINKTPDIRTRPYLPKWGTEIEMRYITPQLNLTSLFNILCNAGVLIGLGDYRQEKGKATLVLSASSPPTTKTPSGMTSSRITAGMPSNERWTIPCAPMRTRKISCSSSTTK